MRGHMPAVWHRGVIRQLRRSEGQAILEFVLVLPLLVTLVFVLVQFGIAFNNYLQVTDAARIGARAAAVARFDGKPACAAAQNAVNNVNSNFGFSCSCPSGCTPGQSVAVTVTDPWSVDLPLLPISDSGTLKGTSTEALE
jgi:Flp pilus assembly protein TadG